MYFQLHHDLASFKAKRYIPESFCTFPIIHMRTSILRVSSALTKPVVSNLFVSIDQLLHEGIATSLHSHTAVGAGEFDFTTRASGAFASLPARTAFFFGHTCESAIDMPSSPSPGKFLLILEEIEKMW